MTEPTSPNWAEVAWVDSTVRQSLDEVKTTLESINPRLVLKHGCVSRADRSIFSFLTMKTPRGPGLVMGVRIERKNPESSAPHVLVTADLREDKEKGRTLLAVEPRQLGVGADGEASLEALLRASGMLAIELCCQVLESRETLTLLAASDAP